jgi:hypothetical protein
LAQEWELHVSMKINIILHCELKFSFSEWKIVMDGK